MYWELDNFDNKLEGVYTGKEQEVGKAKKTVLDISEDGKTVDVYFTVERDGHDVTMKNDGGKGWDCEGMDEAFAESQGVNCEHLWPQSQLKKSGAVQGISNLHHMLPADIRANKYRGDNVFGEVETDLNKSARWIKADRSNAKLPSMDADVSEFGTKAHKFEPRDVSKGNVARAMFYMAAIYGDKLFSGDEQGEKNKAWWSEQIEDLLRWNKIDPPDEREVHRTWKVGLVQGRVNPFVLHPEWIDEFFSCK